MIINIMQLIIIMSFVFAFSEFLLMLVKHSKIKNAKIRNDQGSMILIWVMITFGFIAGFFLARHDFWKPINSIITVVGLLVILMGIIIRWIAIVQLGKSFTVDVAITDAAKLKTDGLYRQIRHPSYLGLLLVILGFSITMNSLISFSVFVIPVTLAVLNRIRVEETVLFHEFGTRYSEYRSKTKKLIPGIY